MIQVSFVGKDHIAKELVRKERLEIAGAKALGKFAIVRATRQGSPTDHREFSPAVELNGHREALQTSMAAIVRDGIRANRPFMRRATEGIAKLAMFRRRLQRGTNRVVVGDG